MRFITALAALRVGRTLLDGNSRMRQRPMADMLHALNGLGIRAYSQTGTVAHRWSWSRMGFRRENRDERRRK